MSWVVRCPECGTIYQLLPDQLKMAQGWLRCGQCQHAFDSTGLVLAWPAALLNDNQVGDLVGRTAHVATAEGRTQGAQSGSAFEAQATVSEFEEALASFKPGAWMTADRAAMPMATAAHEPQTASTPRAQRAQHRGWRSSGLFKLGALLLLLTLALQTLWLVRHPLAAAEPRLARLWQKVCPGPAWVCEIAHLQMRDGIVIDNSSLTPRQEGGFLLSWSWRNATSQPLQTPALELTLLNAQDKALVRRVVLLAELGAPEVLAAGQTWAGQLHLTPEAGLMPAGYRLLGFYP